MKVILFYYILTVFIGLIFMFLNKPIPIVLIKKQKNLLNDNGICLLNDDKCINL
jgi:hypothetical protein